MSNKKDGLLLALEDGLPLVEARPYLVLANRMGCTEEDVIKEIKTLKESGKIKRFGLVIKNRACGYVHNAMVTLDVADIDVDALGKKISEYPFIKLCYQRQRVLPLWPYNLYFMIHGKSRSLVEEQIKQIIEEFKIDDLKMKVLFSVQCFKQKGASYH